MIEPAYLYTVLAKEKGCFVRYIDLAMSEVKSLQGKFDNPDEASKAFEAITGKAAILFLEQKRFTSNVRSLAQYKRLDKRREAETPQ